MNLTKIFSSSFGGIVDSVGNAIDKLVTSDEERLTLKNELQKIRLKADLQAKEIANAYEAEITKRNDSDQVHGNFLTKSARPIFLYWLMFILTCMVFGGLNGIVIDSAYIELIKVLAVTSVTFFFGSKGLEHWKHGRQI